MAQSAPQIPLASMYALSVTGSAERRQSLDYTPRRHPRTWRPAPSRERFVRTAATLVRFSGRREARGRSGATLRRGARLWKRPLASGRVPGGGVVSLLQLSTSLCSAMVWSTIVSCMGRPTKRAAADEDARPCKKHKHADERKRASFSVTPRQLAGLGGAWEGVPPFSGDEDRLYRWLAEPALWARLIMHDLEPRTQQRLVQLHAGIHDGIDASGYVCWRTLPAVQPAMRVTLQAAGLRGASAAMPRVTIRQQHFLPSSRFGEGWEARSFAGPPSSTTAAPTWLRNARTLVQDATFSFMGAPMPVVDEAWAADRFSRQDAVVHALCDTGDSSSTGKRGGSSGAGSSSGAGGSSTVAAAIIETPFPAERLLRSLVNAGKDDELLYIDAIVADRYGAAYRLLCDLVAERRARHPERRLVVVLMSVVSADVLGRYARWGFSYGGLVGQSECAPPVLVDRIDRLHHEMKRFETSMAKPHAPSPCSVVDETMHR